MYEARRGPYRRGGLECCRRRAGCRGHWTAQTWIAHIPPNRDLLFYRAGLTMQELCKPCNSSTCKMPVARAGCSVRRTNSLEQRRSRLQDLAIAHHQFSSCARTLKSGCNGRASVLSGLARTELVEDGGWHWGQHSRYARSLEFSCVLMLGQRRVGKKLGVLILDPGPLRS